MENYIILKFIYIGNSEVTHVRNKIDGKEYVLKKIGKEIGYREIDMLNKIKHEYINILLDWFEDKNYIYLLFNYIKEGSLSYERNLDARYILKQIIKVIDYLHSKNIVHSDLKEENILFDGNNIKLIDFGSSKYIDENIKVNSTLKYIAPELFENKITTKETDLWAIGIIYFKLLTGGFPFVTNGAKSIYLRNKYKSINFSKYNLIEQDIRILKILLNKNPKKRILYQVKKLL